MRTDLRGRNLRPLSGTGVSRMEVIAPVVALFALIATAALAVGLSLWLILFTPFVTWAFYAVVAFLCLRLVLLPFQTGTRVLEEELRSKVEMAFATSFGPGRYSDNYSLNVTGTITNNSNRPIRRIFIACRLPKVSFDSYETTGNHFSAIVRPGETKSFGGLISDSITGVEKTGSSRLELPDRHFCRLDEVYDAN